MSYKVLRQWAGRLRAAIAIGLGMLRHGVLLSGLKIGRTGPSEMDTPRSQNSPDCGYAPFHADVLPFDDTTNFIPHFDCMLIVG